MSTPTAPLRFVAAVDFGDASATAVALAGMLAGPLGARLTVLHAEALEMPPYFTSAQIEALEAERLEARAGAADYLRGFAARHTNVGVEPLVVDGPATEAILQAAHAFDLVILGTHGRRGPRRWWLGSVAEGMVLGATTPILITCALQPDALRRIEERAARLTAGGTAHWTDLIGQTLDAPVHTGAAESVVQTLRACAAPVLYVPDRWPIPSRSSS
jgi:nucleotide-binding universal stress UspA family protein